MQNRRYGDIIATFQTLFALMNGDDIYMTLRATESMSILSIVRLIKLNRITQLINIILFSFSM